MTIELSTEQEARIRKQLATGLFSDQAAVLDEALHLLERKQDMDSFQALLKANDERNDAMTAEEADALAEEAVQWARSPQNR